MADHAETLYLDEIAGLPDLGDDEIRSLFISLRAGDPEASKKLTDGCLKRIVREVQALGLTEIPEMDLIQEGNLALWTYIERSGDSDEDPVYGLDMAVFNALKAVISEETDSRKSGEELSARLNVIDRVCSEIAEREGREAGVEEVAEVMKMDPGDVKYLMQIALSAISRE